MFLIYYFGKIFVFSFISNNQIKESSLEFFNISYLSNEIYHKLKWQTSFLFTLKKYFKSMFVFILMNLYQLCNIYGVPYPPIIFWM